MLWANEKFCALLVEEETETVTQESYLAYALGPMTPLLDNIQKTCL